MKSSIFSAKFYEPLIAIAILKQSNLKTKKTNKSIHTLAAELPNMGYCFAVLVKVSRSFAVVIQQLPPGLRESVALFYLILRVLDSIEDDMNLPLPEKEKWLRNFHRHCADKDLNLSHIGDQPEYRALLQHYHKIAGAFQMLPPNVQNIIADISKQMGNGMADFLHQKIKNFNDYNLYCHYVAGLVGQGLTQLFIDADYENESLRNMMQEADEMGILLQKTNIIRDYAEDYPLGRYFLPENVWQKIAPDYGYFHHYADTKCVQFFHTLLLDALHHIPQCMQYLMQIKNRAVFKFCAIPQVMAFFTLAALFSEKNAGKQTIKISKIKAAHLMVYTENIHRVFDFLNDALLLIEEKVKKDDPLANEILEQTNQLKTMLKNKSFVVKKQFGAQLIK